MATFDWLAVSTVLLFSHSRRIDSLTERIAIRCNGNVLLKQAVDSIIDDVYKNGRNKEEVIYVQRDLENGRTESTLPKGVKNRFCASV